MKKQQNSSFRASALQITNGVHAAAHKLRTARPSNLHSPMKILGLIRIIGAAAATTAALRRRGVADVRAHQLGQRGDGDAERFARGRG